MDVKLDRILPNVQKPARYTGGEFNQIVKNKDEVDVRVAFCFPDTYEIGMSNLGMRILYGVLNNMDNVWCERVFAPWGDMDEELRKNNIPLYALESKDPVKDFDIIAFSLGYEMAYVGLLNMLQLAQVPLRCEDRPGLENIVMAGGTCTYNSEPLVDFVDLFTIGEGEDMLCEVASLYAQAKKEGWTKMQFLRRAADIDGIYVPCFYDIAYNEDGTVKSITPLDGVPAVVTKRIVQDFENSYFPEKTIIPSTEIVHDRVVLELFRGCIRGCRFCQAGYVYRPVRRRSKETLIKHAVNALKDSGYEEMTLSSLSTSDYKELNDLCDGLLEWCEPRKVSLSLPSLRADNFSIELMEKVQRVRKSGLTFAPEAGSQKLRDAINKNVKEEDLMNTCRIAFEGGWNNVKLYFMLGLPTETDEDVVAIADLAGRVVHTWKKYATNKSRGVKITVSTSFFIPKSHTPFQWEAQDAMSEYRRKVELLASVMKTRAITYNWHDPETSYIEAVLARGDRRVGKALEELVKRGGKLQAWSEYFDYDLWMSVFKDCGIDPEFYTTRQRSHDEVLPWDMITAGVRKDFLWKERETAYEGVITPDCRKQCTGCGANLIYKGGRCDE